MVRRTAPAVPCARGVGAPRLVPRARARPPVAPDAGSVRDPRFGGDAPADAGGARRSAIHGLARALADRRRARRGAARRGDPHMAGPRATTAGRSTSTRRPRGSPYEGWPDDLTELPGVGRYTADAVARFAFGRPVLPVDTNVRRVVQRTGFGFGPDAAHALMDLGATVCLSRVPRCAACPLATGCPSRGRRFAPLRRQGRFEGSFRQRRGQDAPARLRGPAAARRARRGSGLGTRRRRPARAAGRKRLVAALGVDFISA